jgi:hypothetical protein
MRKLLGNPALLLPLALALLSGCQSLGQSRRFDAQAGGFNDGIQTTVSSRGVQSDDDRPDHTFAGRADFLVNP